MGDKLSIGEVRARRTDPLWRRRHKVADLTGAGLVFLLVVVPPAAAALWLPAGLAVAVAPLLAGPAALWSGGPRVGFERRTALLVAIPLVNLVVLVPAVWRGAHLHLQRWQGPLQPGWDDRVWPALAAVAVAVWLVTLAGLGVALT